MTMKMNAPGTPPPHRLPVLTEVVRLTDVVEVGEDVALAVAPEPPPAPMPAPQPEPQWMAEVPRLDPLAAVAMLTEQPAPPAPDGPVPPEWLKRRPAHVHMGLPLPAMAPPSPLPPDFSGSWWSRDEGPAVVSAPIPVAVPIPAPWPAPVPSLSEDAMVQRVLDDLGGQIDLMFDHRMREAVVPALARAADVLIEDLKTELARTLHEMVSRAVAVELARERQRREGS
jgi:hypothetical protein